MRLALGGREHAAGHHARVPADAVRRAGGRAHARLAARGEPAEPLPPERRAECRRAQQPGAQPGGAGVAARGPARQPPHAAVPAPDGAGAPGAAAPAAPPGHLAQRRPGRDAARVRHLRCAPGLAAGRRARRRHEPSRLQEGRRLALRHGLPREPGAVRSGAQASLT